jgi:hypothetical protein
MYAASSSLSMTAPGAGRMKAATSSPHFSWGTPMTDLADLWMLEQQLFQFARVDILAAADDHVL